MPETPNLRDDQTLAQSQRFSTRGLVNRLHCVLGIGQNASLFKPVDSQGCLSFAVLPVVSQIAVQGFVSVCA